MNRELGEIEKRVTSNKPDANGFHLGYRPSLDGLRGVAILMVLLSHLWLINLTWGFMGVQIFFVLSGFLITSLLAQEWRRTGGISLRRFYLRRALRLLPALFVMLAVFLLHGAFFRSPADFSRELKEASAAAFYYSNWIQATGGLRMMDLGHTWSLAIEEQYYLVWPALLLFLLLKCRLQTVLHLTILGVFLAWLSRFLAIAGTATTNLRVMLGSDTRADGLLLGSAIGLLLSFRPLPSWRWFRVALKTCAIISVAGLAYLGGFCVVVEERVIVYGWFLMCLFTGIIILELVVSPGSLSHWVLENRFIVYLGKVSYGFYLWHLPIIKIFEHDFGRAGWGQKFLIVFLSIFATLFSYYLIERPFLRLKERFR